MSEPFVHLRLHTAYSLCEGAIKIKDLAKECINKRFPAVAITDTNNMFGVVEFSMVTSENGIQPIIGSLVNIKFKDIVAPIILIAKSDVGYKNLLKLMACFYIENKRHGEYVTFDNLHAYNGGIITLSGGYSGPAGVLLSQNDRDSASDFLSELNSIFPNRFYIEISRTGEPAEQQTENFFINYASQNGVPIVATNEAFYLDKSMHKAHDALLCIAGGTYISVKDRKRLSPEHYLKSSDEMFELFSDLKEAALNTVCIAKRCSFMPEKKNPVLPKFTSDSSTCEDEVIEEQAFVGLQKRLNDEILLYKQNQNRDRQEIEAKYSDRLKYELSVIKSMGFSGYFLIVSDFVKWAKKNNIPVGPGRGSGAGSAVGWTLYITDIDPVRYNLFFERFLNPERISMPDFDIDFCQEGRDEVIRYVQSKYGSNRVAQIIALGKLQARAVIRDVGRVIQLPYGQVDKISKLVPHNPVNPIELSQALEIEPQLRQMMAEDSSVDFLINTALRLEGLYRHASTHAAGIVISNDPIDEIVPLYSDDESDIPITQFNMKFVESTGLVKFDFLGLKTLTVIKHTCDNVKKYHGIDIDISKIDLEDRKTFELLCSVDVVGVFQLESAGMRDVIHKLQPDQIEDLIALVSLYRPGPMDDIPKYLARKHGKEPVTYIHPILEPILKNTYGVMVYQEQVMKIAQEMGGYSLAAADLLRRAMGKKIKSEMEKNKVIFLEGAAKKGVDPEVANQVFALMEKFASYGFNRSHAAPYAMLSYQTAYLKANYRREFYIAVMNLDSSNVDKLSTFAQDAKASGIDILVPDINASEELFTADGSGIRYSLGSLKGSSPAAMRLIVDERKRNGKFKDIFDFFRRLDRQGFSTRNLSSLILSGAFDSIHGNRRQIVESLETLLQLCNKQDSKQMSLFGGYALNNPDLKLVQEYGMLEKLDLEKGAIGFYLSEHPMDIYSKLLGDNNITKSKDFPRHNCNITTAGVLISKKEKLSKHDQKYAFLTLLDQGGVFEISIFPDLFSKVSDMLVVGKALLVEVQLKVDADTTKLLGTSVRTLDSLMQKKKAYLYIDETVDLDNVRTVIESIEDGNNTLSFVVTKKNGQKIEIETKYNKNLSVDDRMTLASIKGVRLTQDQQD
jgi:DNA polymerase-3 subunit alpha